MALRTIGKVLPAANLGESAASCRFLDLRESYPAAKETDFAAGMIVPMV